MKRAAVVVVMLLAVACGREGPLITAPQVRRPPSAGTPFCDLALRLERDAAAELSTLAQDAKPEDLFRALKVFADRRRADYEQLERLAPAGLKPALRAQRTFRDQLATAAAGPARDDLLRRALANGRRIRQSEAVACLSPTAVARSTG